MFVSSRPAQCPPQDYSFLTLPSPFIQTNLSTAARCQAILCLYLFIAVYLKELVGRAPPGLLRLFLCVPIIVANLAAAATFNFEVRACMSACNFLSMRLDP